MKSFIRSVALAATLLLAGSSFAQTAHPVTHQPAKHYKHHKKVYRAKRGLPLPPAPGKLPPAPPRPGKLPAAPPPPPKLPGLPRR